MSATATSARPLLEWLEAGTHLRQSVRTQQELARQRFLMRGFPTRQMEEWKYTAVEAIARRSWQDAAALSLPQRWAIPVSPCAEVCRYLFIDGQLAWMPSAPDGVIAEPLSLALRQEHWQRHFTQIATADHSPFVDLNTALLTDGLALKISGEIALPLEIVWSWRTESDGEAIAAHPRLLIELAPGSRVTLVEYLVGDTTASHFLNSVAEILIGKEAQLTHFVVQESPAAVHQIATHAVRVEAGGRYHSFDLQLGGRLSRRDLNVTLADAEAEAVLEGLFLIGERQHFDTHTRLRHEAPRTSSRERYRLIAVGKGRGVFKGSVRVAPGAVKSDAQQSCKSLLLATGAEIDAKPELEIYTDDVRCSHGATVGRLDRDARFYLLSRGLTPEEAETLLIFAFAEEVVEAIPVPEWRQAITERLISRLPDRAILEEQL